MAISVVNTASGYSAASVGSIAASAINAATGNLIAVLVEWLSASGTITVSSVTDTAGNTYTPLTTQARGDGFMSVQWFYAKNITGNAANVCTATFSASSAFCSLHVLGISGLDTSSPLDVTNKGATGTGTTLTSQSFTTSQADEILLAGGCDDSTVTNWTAGSGYTLSTQTVLSAAEYKIVSSVQTGVTATLTKDQTNDWAFAVVSFKAATSAVYPISDATPFPLRVRSRVHSFPAFFYSRFPPVVPQNLLNWYLVPNYPVFRRKNNSFQSPWYFSPILPIPNIDSITPVSVESTASVGTPSFIETSVCSQLFIGANQYEPRSSTMKLKKTLSSPWGGSCEIVYYGGARPAPGEEITFFWQGVKRFGGIVLTIDETGQPGWREAKSFLKVTFTGYQSYTDRVIVAILFTYAMGGIPGIVFYELWRMYLKDQFGVTKVGNAGPSVVIGEELFHYITLTEAFNQLRDQSPGWDWWIDDEKELHFEDTTPTTPTAPFTLRNGDRNVDSMAVSSSNSRFRNKQWVLPATDVIGDWTDERTGDGTTTSFSTQYALNEAPTVTVNGTEQVVTEQGTWPIDWQVYYILGGTGVFFRTAPAAAQPIEISYVNPFQMAVSAQDDASIAAVGLYESVYQSKNITDEDTARAFAQGLLDMYGTNGIFPESIEFSYNSDSQSAWLTPGMIIDVDHTFPTALGNYTVEQIDSEEQEEVWRHSVTLRAGLGDVNETQLLEMIRQAVRTQIIDSGQASGDGIISDDGVEFPTAIARRNWDKHGERISPLDFGAVGDGVTDDTAAWLRTIAQAISTNRPIWGGGFTYKVSKQGTTTYSWDSLSHPYVFLLTAPIVIHGPALFTLDITDANTANLFVFQNASEVRLSGIKCTGVGSQASILLYNGAVVSFVNCRDCRASDIEADNMRGGVLFFNCYEGEVLDSYSYQAANNRAGSHFASYGSSNILIRDCTGYGTTRDGDVTHFGTDSSNRATGNRITGCKLYAYAFGDSTRTIFFTDAQGYLLDSGQELGSVDSNYAYGFYYGVDVKTTGEGNEVHHNTLEKCKVGVAVRRGEGNAPTYNTLVNSNIIRPLGGNGNTDNIANSSFTLTKVCGIFLQDSPGTTVSGNLTEASWLFGSGEQDFISVVGLFSESTFAGTQLDGPWIKNNRFMQVMNVGGNYTYSKNAAVYITGTSVAKLQRGCVDGNDFNLFIDSALTYHPLSLTNVRQFTIRGNHFGGIRGEFQSILVSTGSFLTLADNTFDTSPGFMKLVSINKLTIRGNIFGNEVRNSVTVLPVSAIYLDTCTRVAVANNIQEQDADGGSDDGYFLETSASGNTNIVLSGNNLTKKLFLPHWYKINGVEGNSSQDIYSVGNIINGRLSIGSVMTSRTWAIRALSGNWIVDGATGPALAAATSQTIDLGNYASADGLGQLPAYAKMILVNITGISGFTGTGFTSVTARLSDSTGGAGAYTSTQVALTTGNFVDMIPLRASILQTATNLQLTITANQNMNASSNALSVAFSITVQWVKMTVPNFTV